MGCPAHDDHIRLEARDTDVRLVFVVGARRRLLVVLGNEKVVGDSRLLCRLPE